MSEGNGNAKDGEKKGYETNELKRVSCELFAASFAMAGGRINPEALSDAAIGAAAVFLTRFNKFKAGEIVFDRLEDALADVHAPNLRPTHPVNLVSQKFGKVDRLKDIWAMLEKVPETAESWDEFPDWKKADISTAKVLIPAALKRAETIAERIAKSNRVPESVN